MSERCRLCCRSNAATYIFQKEPDDLEIFKKILYCCVNINIKDGDGLPTHICDSCNKQLAKCYQFILKCEESDKKLRAETMHVISQAIVKECTPKDEVKLEINNSIDDHYLDIQNDMSIEQGEQEFVEIKEEICKNSEVNKSRKKRTMGLYICTVCGRHCPNPSSYKVHMRSHTSEKPYQCSSCDKSYKHRGTLRRHIDRHHIHQKRARDYICETCGKGFYAKSYLQVHIRTHTGETPYECPICAVRFTQISALYRHKKRHNHEKDHLCQSCPKKFCTKQELKNHLIAHSTEKKYSCPLCNVLFKYQNNLKKHIRLHSEPKRFVCNHCGVTFKLKGNLKHHIDTQHSEKSGHCTVCAKNVANIEEHMWRHTGQRPLKCELCASSFFELKTLARHMNFRHKKTDRHKCDVEGCAMAFPSRPMLDFHIAKLHSTNIPFPCDRCSRAFYRKNDLARHKIGTHKERLL